MKRNDETQEISGGDVVDERVGKRTGTLSLIRKENTSEP